MKYKIGDTVTIKSLEHFRKDPERTMPIGVIKKDTWACCCGCTLKITHIAPDVDTRWVIGTRYGRYAYGWKENDFYTLIDKLKLL